MAFKANGMTFDSMKQALNFSMQSGALPMGKIIRVYGENKVKRVGEVYMDVLLDHPVRLVDLCGNGEWEVVEVLTGETYWLPFGLLSENPLTEMEVVAWAATQ